jgi:dTDP-L-rhamnose 4-epimerase
VYGARQALSNPYTGIVAIFTSRLLNNKPPLIFEDGLQSRDFTHVSDIVQANMLAMECDSMNYDYFNVGTGRRLSVLDIAKALIVALGKDLTPVIAHKFREGDIRHCYGDISKLVSASGYAPKVSFEKGVPMLIEWCRHQQAEDNVAKATEELASKGLTK